MKFSTQEEYGLRCLIRIGKSDSPNGLTIPEISDMEGLSTANVGKLLRVLRMGGYIESTRGQTGGYRLARPADKIVIANVMADLGGRLFDDGFCEYHSGVESLCTHTVDCSIRSLWGTIQSLLDNMLTKVTLQDLLGKEEKVTEYVETIAEKIETPSIKNK